MKTPDIRPTLCVLALFASFFLPESVRSQTTDESQTTDDLLTVAERSGFQATSRSAEVVEMIDRLASSADHVHRFQFGTTVEERPMVAAVVASPPVTTPEQLAGDSRLVVLLLGNIHSGECAGKEALLMMLRELSRRSGHPWLKNIVIVFVPNYNADANDRVALNNRPGQIGPALGMGRRANAQQLDLNRDFGKLESPEARSLVALFDSWNPHLMIDTHTTNGSRHRYALTYDIPHNPATAPAIREFLRQQMMPEVTRRLEDQEINAFYYGNFNRTQDRWTTYGYEPRYSTEYFGMRGRLAILCEAYSYITYEERINAIRAFVGQCLSYLSGHASAVKTVLDTAQRETSAAKRRAPIRSELVAFDDQVVIKGYEGRSTESPRDYTVTFYGRYQPVLEVDRPWAYLIPAAESLVAERLRMHGVRLEALESAVEADVEVYRATDVQRSRSFQGHRMVLADCDVRRERRMIEQGTYVARTAQPLGDLLVYLLEPESDDGLITWNFFDPFEASDDFPVTRLAAPLNAATRPVTQIKPGGRLSLDQIYGPVGKVDFAGATAPRWLPNSNQFVEGTGRGRTIVDAKTGESGRDMTERAMATALAEIPAISQEDARRLAGETHPISSDSGGALIQHNGDLFYYSIAERSAVRLTDSPEAEQIPSFSPDGKRVAFVRANDLFVIAVDGTGERPLTRDGSDQTLNGLLDWVYQEELYGRGNYYGYWWSPDSKRIAFLQLDERPVHRYTVSDHLPVRAEQEITPYPKSGDPLPRVRLGTLPVSGGAVAWFSPADDDPAETLVSRVDWSRDSNTVFFQVQDRAQTWLDVRRGEPTSGRNSTWFREQTGAWVNVFGPPYELADGSVLWLSERSGNKHIYRVSPDASDPQALTSGPWDVQSIEGLDQDRQWIYLTATKDSPLAAAGYRMRVDGGSLERITPDDGHHALSFSDSREFFFDTRSTAHSPPEVKLYQADGTLIRPLGTGVNETLAHLEILPPEHFQVPTRDGQTMDAMLIKPPNFDPAKKYPVLVYAYSGPQAPVVRDRWGGERYLWHQYLAQQGICIWMCDNRSATLRGAQYAWPVHRDLGRRELADIEDGVEWLVKKPWIDSERIGIWGWSYGGYITSYALTHSKRFKIGISGAPVTDWRNYDAIYTERYMGLPQDNPQGYDDSSVVKAAANLHGKLLLIHGTIDDNVHMSNTIQLAYALQQAGRQFDLMLYPKSRHGVTDEAQLRHLRELMTRFVLDGIATSD